ncbi:hypothetical protein EE612_056818 [Oryza sativa]|nr:hypothetical protein EE612_056818 [Oryza sativa]
MVKYIFHLRATSYLVNKIQKCNLFDKKKNADMFMTLPFSSNLIFQGRFLIILKNLVLLYFLKINWIRCDPS